MSKRFLLVAMCLVFSCIAVCSFGAGSINISENFEGATAFVDQNWPVVNLTTVVTPAEIAARQGIAVRAGATSTAKAITTQEGTIVTERHFAGAQSYKLASGQGIRPLKGNTQNNLRSCRVRQFAISFSTETLPAAGTKVGHYLNTWTIANNAVTTVSTDVADARYGLEFRVGADGKSIDVMCTNTASKVGNFLTGVGGWGIVSIIRNPSITAATPDAPLIYVSYDTWTSGTPSSSIVVSGFKGPNNGPTATGPGATTPIPALTLAPGIYAYLNSDAGNFTPRASVGTITGAGITDGSWGFDNDTATANWNSAEITWELVAEGGVPMYVDNLYDDNGQHNITAGEQGIELEFCNRMVAFNGPKNGNEPPLSIEADVKGWELY